MRSRRRIAFAVCLALAGSALGVLGVAQGIHTLGTRRYGALTPACRVQTERPVVALSFDDGPDRDYTPAVLALLERYGDRATFFLVGEHARARPELVRMELAAGMETGNHTWSHPHLPSLTRSQASGEIVRTEELLRSLDAGGRLFRAPFGELSPEQLAGVRGMGLEPVHWSLALDHYVGGMGLTPQDAAAALARDARTGDIILAHDAHLGPGGRETALETLRLLLPALQERGFEVTSVGELLGMGNPIRARPRPWFWESGFTCPRP